MDPTAQTNSQPQDSQSNAQQANPILPGQFIVAGETPNQAPSLSNISAPAQAPTPAPATTANPDELLNSLAAQVGGKALNQDQATNTPAPVAAQPAPVVTPATPEQSPLDVMQTAQNQQAPSAPDPTPFVPPQGAAVPPPTQQSTKSDKIKLILIILGVVVAIALIAFIAFFYLSNKNKKPAKIDNTQESTIEEPSPPPARTEGGFADVPQPTSTDSASELITSPSPSVSTQP